MTTRETIESVSSYETEQHTYEHWIAAGGPAADRAQRKALVLALNVFSQLASVVPIHLRVAAARAVLAIDEALGMDGLSENDRGKHSLRMRERYHNKRTKHG